MAEMIEKLDYEYEDGSVKGHEVTVFALSTCAFCKKAIRFLQEQDVAFRYVYLDKINPLVKRTVKGELKKKFENLPVFPVLVIDKERALSGFSEDRWKEELDLE